MKTDIYGTLGPSCAGTEILGEMLSLGMTGVRLNLSHISLKEARPMLDSLHAAVNKTGKTCKLLIDMQGPELRTGSRSTPLNLTEGMSIDTELLHIPQKISEAIQPGQDILLDDGKLLLRAKTNRKLIVIRGGTLTSRKSIALPGVEIHLPPLNAEDMKNITCAAEYGVTGVMQPFVRSQEDLKAVRTALYAAGCNNIRLFAKIEDKSGVESLPDLLDYADEIVIARGDLGNSVPLWELPAVQKMISAKCRASGKPFMVVTQMLASMEHSSVPTRAEVSDIFNAVLDGASSVMVTGETASGKYPVEAIRFLVNTVTEAERFISA